MQKIHDDGDSRQDISAPHDPDKFQSAILFIFIALPSSLIFIFSSFLLIADVVLPRERQPNISSILFRAVLTVASMFSMLFGIGKWKQWRYLVVFISIPIGFWLAIGLTDSKAGLPWTLLLIPVLIYFARAIARFNAGK